jgi:hypothetical protein
VRWTLRGSTVAPSLAQTASGGRPGERKWITALSTCRVSGLFANDEKENRDG